MATPDGPLSESDKRAQSTYFVPRHPGDQDTVWGLVRRGLCPKCREPGRHYVRHPYRGSNLDGSYGPGFYLC